MLHHALIMLAAGIGIPVLAALNAALGRHIGSPAVAACTLFVVAFSVALVVALATNPQAVAKLATAPRHLFIAGVFVAFYVLSITWIAPVMGVGNAVFFVLLGQLISAAAIDHYGMFAAQSTPLNWTRAAGIALMATGVFVTQKT
ncbi:DMT family transporter [Yoonia sp. BS5-3]|uniref:DMT family transporter n=1 Tax=Yoonia phaeophyticola TaxID=3137369 RepID=A0ABZ2VBD0_9RHOB